MSNLFWDTNTDKAIVEWVEGKGKDDTLYIDYIEKPLRFYSQYIIHLKARIITTYADSREQLVEELITSAATALLFGFKPHSSKPMNFVHSVMINYISNKYIYANRLKRQFTTLVKVQDINDGSSQDDVIDYFNLYNEDKMESIINDDTTKIVLEYWQKNADKHFRQGALTTVNLIIDIIAHPEKHLIKKNDGFITNYSTYICKKRHITRERLRQILYIMNVVTNRDLKKYL